MTAFFHRRLFSRFFPWFSFQCLLLACLLTTAPSSVALEAIEDSETIVLPADFNNVHFYLLTVDAGKLLWDKFGHTALRVVDEGTQTDIVLNWGSFDFSDPISFSIKFFRGITDFKLEPWSTEQFYNAYSLQGRTLWQDKINLTNSQKEVLYKRIAWNLRAENISYSYHYFFDNCTTRLRDYLDEAMGGKIAMETRGIIQSTFRDKIRYHYSSMPFIAGALDVLLNSDVDRPISQWEEMFLPLSLRSTLTRLSSDVITNRQALPLLSEPETIFEFTPPQAKTSVWLYVVLGLLAPLLLLCFFLKRVPLSALTHPSGLILRSPAFSYRVLAIVGILVSLCSGVLGLIMATGWIMSGQTELHHNVNLLLFWPTDLFGLVISVYWLISVKPWSLGSKLHTIISYYLLAHVLALFLYPLVFFLGISDQAQGAILLFVAPGLLLFTILVGTVGFSVNRSPASYY